MLLYIGIADAYAAGAEYLKFPRDEKLLEEILKFEKYHQHPVHADLKPGQYTDDTEMSIANAKVLLGQDRLELDFADAYVAEFILGNKRKGYAKGFQAFLESVKDGVEFATKIRNDSKKNGACMRAAVLGVLPSVQHVFKIAKRQAQLTHDTPEGIFSAQAVALMSHFALYTSWDFFQIIDTTDVMLKEFEQFRYVFFHAWDSSPVIGSSEASVAITTIQAVITLLLGNNSLMSMMKTLLTWGGDTDSVAAVAWGIASCRYQNEVLPQFLYNGIENPRYLKDIGTQLMNKFNKE